MIVLTDSASPQSFTIIPRFEPVGNVRVTLTSEAQNKATHTLTLTGTWSSGKLTVNTSYSPTLVLDTFYGVEIVDVGSGNALMYRGRIFCTDQTELDKYTTQDGDFTEYDGTNNEFMTI